MSNAIKYGGNKPINLVLEKQGNLVIFEVKDKGVGIEKKHLRYLFDKFSQAITAKEFKGLGVGLYITKQIVEAHGGKITVSSKKNIGTTFTVTLPI